jgi:hypothetical protein
MSTKQGAHHWQVADTTVDLSACDDQVFTMRQVSLTVPATKTGRANDGQDAARQIHILTTRADLSAEQVIYRMGSRWRQENCFRYVRMHFELDSHDAYPPPATTPPGWSQPHQEESPPYGPRLRAR